jgi:hypothetical protein
MLGKTKRAVIVSATVGVVVSRKQNAQVKAQKNSAERR